MRRYLLFLIFLLLSSPSYAAITLLDSPVTFDNGELGTLTATRLATTTSAGTNTMGVVTITGYHCGAVRNVSTVTKGADSYVAGATINRTGICNNWTTIFYKLNPTAASSTVTVTMDNTTDGIFATYSTWAGVKQSSQPDNSQTESGAGDTSPETMDITVNNGGSIVIDVFNSDAGSGTTAQTLMGNGASYVLASSPGAQTLSWTSGTGDSYVHAANSFQPAVSASTDLGDFLDVLQ